jgi:exodeoxyribonuclease-3
MRLATWNVNSLGARLPLVLEWTEANGPDVLCLQETKLADDAFPAAAFADLGYQSAHYGDGRWNGVAIVSRVGLDDPVNGFHSDEDAQGTRIVAATCQGVRVHSVYVPNGRSLDSEHFAFKLAWLARLRAYLGETVRPDGAVAVCGDFNVAPRDTDVWDPAQFVGATHVSEPERAALGDVLDWGLVDVFPRFHPDGGIFSWWDYRAGNFHKGHGMRIDLVLLTRSLADRCTSVEIDREARKKSPAGNKPSDHTVVAAEIDLDGA